MPFPFHGGHVGSAMCNALLPGPDGSHPFGTVSERYNRLPHLACVAERTRAHTAAHLTVQAGTHLDALLRCAEARWPWTL